MHANYRLPRFTFDVHKWLRQSEWCGLKITRIKTKTVLNVHLDINQN